VFAAFDPRGRSGSSAITESAGSWCSESVFLVATGAEAIYADLGHFGLRSFADLVRRGVPALLLNYLGQGALLLRDPAAAEHPFYLLVPAPAADPGARDCDGGDMHRVAGG